MAENIVVYIHLDKFRASLPPEQQANYLQVHELLKGQVQECATIIGAMDAEHALQLIAPDFFTVALLEQERVIIRCDGCNTNNIVAFINPEPRCGNCERPLAVQALAKESEEQSE